MIGSIREFIDVTRGAAPGVIYELFERDTAPAVRAVIIELAPVSSREPVRDGLRELGRMFDSDALRRY